MLDSFYYKRNDIKLDTFYAGKHNKIPFEVVFNKEGINYINGIIDDIVYLKTQDSSKIRILSNETVLSKEVYVHDASNGIPKEDLPIKSKS